jgi:hypothetical protein
LNLVILLYLPVYRNSQFGISARIRSAPGHMALFQFEDSFFLAVPQPGLSAFKTLKISGFGDINSYFSYLSVIAGAGQLKLNV